MYCSHCGKKIPDGSRFCPECGAKLNVTSSTPSYQNTKVNETHQHSAGTSVPLNNYFKWIVTGAVVLMFIGLFLPVAKVSMFGISESAHLSDFELSDIGDLISLLFLILGVVAAVVTLVFQFLPNLRQYGNFTSIGSFALTLIYYFTIKHQIKDYSAIASIGSGTVLIMIGSIVLLVLGIINLVQKQK